MKCSTFSRITLPTSLRPKSSPSNQHERQLLNHENGGSTFLRNFGNFYQSTWRHMPYNSSLHSHWRDNVIYRKFMLQKVKWKPVNGAKTLRTLSQTRLTDHSLVICCHRFCRQLQCKWKSAKPFSTKPTIRVWAIKGRTVIFPDDTTSTVSYRKTLSTNHWNLNKNVRVYRNFVF
jgi:hypothetical protein